jgi:EPS-associated MarR family transcriptional regulator
MNNDHLAPPAAAANPDAATIHQDTHLKVLRVLQAKPHISQRDLAAELGVSLGKTNFCLKALLDKGLVKMQSFKQSQNKLAYAYLLTPAGMAQKVELTTMFLRRKQQEFVELKAEIDKLQLEVAGVVEEISR